MVFNKEEYNTEDSVFEPLSLRLKVTLRNRTGVLPLVTLVHFKNTSPPEIVERAFFLQMKEFRLQEENQM